jgi:serine/threonine protein kinase
MSPGESLSTLIGRHPTGLPLPQVRSLFLDTARAVAYLHDRGVVHRDLKPGNVLVEYGVAKVGDHGLAKAVGGSRSCSRLAAVGTVYYMAPEISSGNYNRQIDVYSVGVILRDAHGHGSVRRSKSGRNHDEAPHQLRRPAEVTGRMANQ